MVGRVVFLGWDLGGYLRGQLGKISGFFVAVTRVNGAVQTPRMALAASNVSRAKSRLAPNPHPMVPK